MEGPRNKARLSVAADSRSTRAFDLSFDLRHQESNGKWCLPRPITPPRPTPQPPTLRIALLDPPYATPRHLYIATLLISRPLRATPVTHPLTTCTLTRIRTYSRRPSRTPHRPIRLALAFAAPRLARSVTPRTTPHAASLASLFAARHRSRPLHATSAADLAITRVRCRRPPRVSPRPIRNARSTLTIRARTVTRHCTQHY